MRKGGILMKRSFILVSILFSVLLFSGCSCTHEWNPATCSQPKTCRLCGTTDGEPLGHQYENVTCADPGICHNCNQPGEYHLPHTPGTEIFNVDYIRGYEVITTSCTECGAELDRAETPVSLIKDNYYILNALEFLERLNSIYGELGMTDWEASIYNNGYGTLCAMITHGNINYATITFNTANNDPFSDDIVNQMTQEQMSEPIVCQLAILINFYDIVQQTHQKELSASADQFDTAMDFMLEMLNDADIYYNNIVTPVLKACDPAMTDAEIEETFNIYTETSLYASDDCGELSVQYINGFLLMMCHIITISTSADFNAVAPN